MGGCERAAACPSGCSTSIIATSHGGASAIESLGVAPTEVLVIETDGTIEQADSLKVAYDGAPATGLDIFRHPLAAAAAHPAIRARQQGIADLADTCRSAPYSIAAAVACTCTVTAPAPASRTHPSTAPT